MGLAVWAQGVQRNAGVCGRGQAEWAGLTAAIQRESHGCSVSGKRELFGFTF